MRKGGRPVAFKDYMRGPRRAITGEHHASEKPKAAAHEQTNKAGDRRAGAEKMPKPGFGAAMLSQVMRPELRIIFKTACMPSLRPSGVTGHGSQPTIETGQGCR